MPGNHPPWQETGITVQPHRQSSGQLPTSDQKKQEAKDYGNKATEWACASCHLSPLWFSTATRETDVLLETTGSWAAGLSGDALSGQDPLVSNVLNQKPVTLSSSSGFTHMVQSYPHKGPQSPPHLSRLLQTPSLQSSKWSYSSLLGLSLSTSLHLESLQYTWCPEDTQPVFKFFWGLI